MKGSELPKSVSFICKTSKKSRMWFRSFGVQIAPVRDISNNAARVCCCKSECKSLALF